MEIPAQLQDVIHNDPWVVALAGIIEQFLVDDAAWPASDLKRVLRRHRLLQMIAQYDYVRSNHMRDLEARLIDALQWSAKPLVLNRLPSRE